MGQLDFKKHVKSRNFSVIFYQTQQHECFCAMLIHKNHFKKQKYGTEFV